MTCSSIARSIYTNVARRILTHYRYLYTHDPFEIVDTMHLLTVAHDQEFLPCTKMSLNISSCIVSTVAIKHILGCVLICDTSSNVPHLLAFFFAIAQFFPVHLRPSSSTQWMVGSYQTCWYSSWPYTSRLLLRARDAVLPATHSSLLVSVCSASLSPVCVALSFRLTSSSLCEVTWCCTPSYKAQINWD
jgi:hypothetical protein